MLNKALNKLNSTNIYLLFLFVYSLRIFFIQDVILWIYGVVGITYFVLKQKKMLLGFQGVVLCILTPLYGLVYKYYFTEIRGYTWVEMVYMVFLPVFMYLLSRQFAWKKDDKTVEKALWCVAGGTFVYSLLNHWMFLREGFLGNTRIWTEFWSKDPIYATEASFWAVFITALGGYGVSCLLHRAWKKGICATAGVLIGNLINIQVGNRMVFMTAFVAAGISLGMFFILNRKDGKIIRRGAGIIIVVALAVGILSYFNLDKIQQSSYFMNILGRDGGIFHNVRFAMIKETWEQLPANLWGGGHINPAGFAAAHNYWLQAANDTGIITLILWGMFIVIAIADALRLMFFENISNGVKYMLVPMLAAVAAYMMMEQAGPGRCTYVNFFVMLCALMRQIINNKKRERNNADSKILRRSGKSNV